MTMVAGCVLPDGALLGADCRLTATPVGRSSCVSDCAAKIIRFGEANAIGYSCSDIQTVSWLLGEARHQMKQRRSDPVSVSLWLPRLLRATYRAIVRTFGVRANVELIVAGSIQGRRTRVPWKSAYELLLNTSGRNSNNFLWLRCLGQPLFFGQDLYVPGSSAGLVYVMRSPDFTPTFCKPLAFDAIGSGRSAALEVLNEYRPLIMCDRPDLAHAWFVDALAESFVRGHADGVGGALLTCALERGEVMVGLSSRTGEGGGILELAARGWRFVARDAANGQEVELLYPGELGRAHLRPARFDGLKEATERDSLHRTAVRNLLSGAVAI